VTDTVETVKGTVEGTVESVKESVQGTVDTVKDAFDFASHYDRNPWLFVGGSVAVGFLVDRMMPPPRAMIREARHAFQGVTSSFGGRSDGNGAHAYAAAPAAAGPGWMEQLTGSFSGEISRLKSLAIGTALGLVRDSLTQNAPEPLRPRIAEVINDITARLGGERIEGPLMKEEPPQTAGTGAYSAGAAGPGGALGPLHG
jgi:hypothetical protein